MKDNIKLVLAKEKRLSVQAIYWRIKRYGSPYKKHDGREKLFIGDKRAVDVAKKNGISEILFRGRIKRGWTVERAATQPARVAGRAKNE